MQLAGALKDSVTSERTGEVMVDGSDALNLALMLDRLYGKDLMTGNYNKMRFFFNGVSKGECDADFQDTSSLPVGYSMES